LPGFPHGALDLRVDDRETPPDDFARFQARWHFTLDVAATPANAKCARFFTAADDGLRQSWAGERVWCNPPYSNVRPWIEKAWAEACHSANGYLPTGAPVIVMLLPANRTEQGWWQELVEPFRDERSPYLRTEFLRGRTDFLVPPGSDGKHGHAPFGCVLVIFGRPMYLEIERVGREVIA
jgi:phage N-6-adenine-methyltransferase